MGFSIACAFWVHPHPQVFWFSLNMIQARFCCLAQRLYLWSCFISSFFSCICMFHYCFYCYIFGRVVYV
jgi:hypothetical protein